MADVAKCHLRGNEALTLAQATPCNLSSLMSLNLVSWHGTGQQCMTIPSVFEPDKGVTFLSESWAGVAWAMAPPRPNLHAKFCEMQASKNHCILGAVSIIVKYCCLTAVKMLLYHLYNPLSPPNDP
jgi:hypothetical protein